MAITLLCVGKLREAYWRDAADEYVKRLSRFTRLQVEQVPDLPEDEGEKTLRREGEALLARVRPQDHVIALCVEGEMTTSEALAGLLNARAMAGGRTAFVIGGSLGLSEDVLRRANQRISLSRMTFPHQMARVILLEQLYRAYKINAGERYHK